MVLMEFSDHFLVNLKDNNMRRICVFLVFLTTLSCENKKEETHYFDLFTYNNELYNRNELILKIIPESNEISKVSVEGTSGDYWFYEDFYERYNSGEGIYRKFDNDEYYLCYRFDSTLVSQKVMCPEKSMFFYPNITLSEKKSYRINGKSYNVFAFSENRGSSGVVSYYLESFGFFAYDLNNNYYKMCKRASSYNGISKELLETICDSLVKDTCFFSIYRFNGNNPCFREIMKGSYNPNQSKDTLN